MLWILTLHIMYTAIPDSRQMKHAALDGTKALIIEH